MRTFGLIGYPLSHSFSKNFFAEKFAKTGVQDAEYRNFPLASIDELPQLLKDNPGLQGFNITIPYKEKVMAYLHHADEVVMATRACNCVKIEEGKLYGFNTDVTGFEQSLDLHLQPHHDKALVLGTGGASKAVEYILNKKGIPFTVVSRTPELPHSIAYNELNEEWMASHKLLINTTPLGMYPNVEEYPKIPYAAITPKHYLIDLIYNPAKTKFLEMGEARGAVIQNGLQMLVVQAEESWGIWNDR